MRLFSRTAVAVAVFPAVLTIFASEAAAQGSGLSFSVQAREPWLTVDVPASAEATGPLRVTYDARSVARNKFETLMTRADYDIDGRPCPAGHQCFNGSLHRDPYAQPGRQSIGFRVSDERGRVAQQSATIDVSPSPDRDRDGLPDLWESDYGFSTQLPGGDTGESGPQGDPDGDGVTNLEEFHAHTNPRGRYQRVFAEASYGERQPLSTCVVVRALPASLRYPQGYVRLLAVGDEGRTSEYVGNLANHRTLCPLEHGQVPFAGVRIAALVVESDLPFVAERQSIIGGGDGLPGTVVNASFGVQAPAPTWFFARGGTDRELDQFFLALNPGSEPVEATFRFIGGPGDAQQTLTRTLAPGVRTTVWVNREVSGLPRDAATIVDAGGPVYVERAWRHRAPGVTAPHDSVSRGAAVPSTWWYFSIGDLSAPFDTSFAVLNPHGQATRVEARFLFADRAPETRTLDLPAASRLIVKPRDLGIGGAGVSLVLHSADGVSIVAERTTDGATATSAWRASALGVTEIGSTWTFADAGNEQDWVIANPSTSDARVKLTFYTNYSYASDQEVVATVPAGRVVTVPHGSMFADWVEVKSEAARGTGPAPAIIVERAAYVDVDGVRRARQVSIAGNLTQP